MKYILFLFARRASTVSLAVSLIFPLVVPLSFSQRVAASELMQPQAKSPEGPWFEGWYIRVTDSANNLSFATITTSSTNQKIPLRQDYLLPGYVAFIYSLPGEVQTHSLEYFPSATQSRRTQDPTGNPHFQWEAPGYGTLTDQNLDLQLPSGDQVHLTIGESVPWNKVFNGSGPEGPVGLLPWLPLNWFVESLGSPVSYEITLASTGQTIRGTGFAHIEKNWGKIFPKAWMWLQGTSPDNSRHVALAGGPVGLGPAQFTSYLIGYKSPETNFTVGPGQILISEIETTIDPCHHQFRIQAFNGLEHIAIEATATDESFAPVSIPTVKGYEPKQGIESFRAHIHVGVERFGRSVEQADFENAALEFGASNMICGK